MKWLAVAGALLLGGCFPDFENPHLGPRGLTEEDLKAPPGHSQIRAAVINDIRNRRALHLSLDDGTRAVPDDLELDRYGRQAVRAKDKYELWRIVVREDPPELVHAIIETAYWDNELFQYHYHYEGGSPHRDVWMGPFPVKFPKPPEDHDQH